MANQLIIKAKASGLLRVVRKDGKSLWVATPPSLRGGVADAAIQLIIKAKPLGCFAMLMKQLAIPLGEQTTLTKWLVIAMTATTAVRLKAWAKGYARNDGCRLEGAACNDDLISIPL
ncbi:MAG: hypothetical protein Q7T25_08765 [Sideroxyarcus sp.]|nr:hypothetical protein [Sideroxyarcus sp.]